MVAPVKTTAWGGHHGSHALVLDEADYSSITKAKISSTKPVNQPDTINKGITATSTPLEILTFQEETKKLQKEFGLQEAVTNIGLQCIIDCSKNSTKNILVLPTATSTVFSIISKPTGARS